MWKYVTRRVRDTVERTSNVLDVKRTWTCSNGEKFLNNCASNTDEETQNQAVVKCSKPKKVCFFTAHRNKRNYGAGHSSSSSSNDEEFKEKIRAKHACFFKNYTLLGALTWSSAIICGWYTSQLICLSRRNTGWDRSRCRYSRYLLSPSRALHTNVLTHRALAAPPLGSVDHGQMQFNYDHHDRQFDEHLFEAHKVVYEQQKPSRETNKQPPAQNLDEAVRDLITVLGDSEYQMGVQNIEAGHYKTAVAHLKLATSHKHAGATFNLGLCYEQGLGVEQNLNIAQELYQMASALGHPKAMYNLGVFYAQGLGGLKRNKHAARTCFNAAAHLGQRDARIALGYPMKENKLYMSDTKKEPSTLLSSAMKLKTIATACT